MSSINTTESRQLTKSLIDVHLSSIFAYKARGILGSSRCILRKDTPGWFFMCGIGVVYKSRQYSMAMFGQEVYMCSFVCAVSK